MAGAGWDQVISNKLTRQRPETKWKHLEASRCSFSVLPLTSALSSSFYSASYPNASCSHGSVCDMPVSSSFPKAEEYEALTCTLPPADMPSPQTSVFYRLRLGHREAKVLQETRGELATVSLLTWCPQTPSLTIWKGLMPGMENSVSGLTMALVRLWDSLPCLSEVGVL